MKTVDTRRTDAEPQDVTRAVIESRVFYRRRLAEKITITLLQETMRKGNGLADFYGNGAQYIEDLANAVAERVAAREDKELGL